MNQELNMLQLVLAVGFTLVSGYMMAEETHDSTAASAIKPYAHVETEAARALVPFSIHGQSYIAVPQKSVMMPGKKVENLDGGDSSRATTDIYQIKGQTLSPVQSLPTQGAHWASFFSWHGQDFLSVATLRQGAYPDYEMSADSHIFRWQGQQFEAVQTVPLTAAKFTSFAEIDGQLFVFFATGDVMDSKQPIPTNGRSMVMKYNVDTKQFDEVQRLPTHSGFGIQTFAIEGATYLGVVDATTGTTIYRWDKKQFKPYQVLTQNMNDRELSFIQIDGKHYVALTNIKNGTQIFAWQGNKLVPVQMLQSGGSHRPTFYQNDQGTWLFVSHYMTGTQQKPVVSTASSVYRWQNGQFAWVTDYPSSASPSTMVWSDASGAVYAGVANEASTTFDLKTNSTIYQLDLAKLLPAKK
jgi:hypothetical protein